LFAAAYKLQLSRKMRLLYGLTANNSARRLVTAALGPLADHVTSRVKARKIIKAGKYNLPNNLQVLFSR